jgi:hypothetical protein
MFRSERTRRLGVTEGSSESRGINAQRQLKIGGLADFLGEGGGVGANLNSLCHEKVLF